MRFILVQLGIFLVLVLPSIVIFVYSYIHTRQDLTDQTLYQRQSLAQLMAFSVEARLDNARDVSKIAASNIASLVAAKKWNEATKQLESISQEFSYADRIFLTDKSGILKGIYPPSPENIGRDFSFRDWYKGVSKNWEPYASEVFKRAPQPQFNTVAVAVPIKDDKGNITGVLGIAMSLDSFYELISRFDLASEGFVYIVNQKGQIVAHPRYSALGDIIDFSSAPVVQKLMQGQTGVGVYYNPVDKENRLAAYQLVPNYNWGVVIAEPIETAFLQRDNSLKNMGLVFSIVLIGNILFAVLTLIGINHIRKSREKLNESNELYNFVSKATNDVIYDWHIVENKLSLSDRIQTAFGYNPEEVSQTLDWWLGLIHPEDKAKVEKEIDDTIKGTNNKIALEYRFRRGDGTYAYVVDRAYLVRNPAGKAIRYIGVMQDITKEKEIDKAKTEFVSLASHQLRTPLSSINWYSEMLLAGDAGKLSPEQTKYLNEVAIANQRMVELVNSLLNVSRLDMGTFSIEPEVINVVEIAKSIVLELEPQVFKQRQKLTENYDEKIPQMNVDKKLFRMILQNLLSNAIKYTPENGSVDLTMKLEDKNLLITVKDTGFGIPKEQQNKIFSKLFRADNVREKDTEGTGLGLYIIKSIIDNTGGKIWFDSIINKGTTFYVQLPLSGMKKKEGTRKLS